jgi:hypothetical protein
VGKKVGEEEKLNELLLQSGSYILEILLVSEGRCFFGPSTQGLRSFCSLSSLQGNELILRGATFGGLHPSKVLKTIDNHYFLVHL